MPVNIARPSSDTAFLIAHSSLVIAHSSTAIGMAVLLRKPIKLVIPHCLIGRPEQRHIEAMGDALERGREDYITRYLGTPEAMNERRRPEAVLEAYFHA